MSKKNKTRTNADALLELEARRAKARKVIGEAEGDATVLNKICAHCKEKGYCCNRLNGRFVNDANKCVDNVLDWLEQEAEK